MDFTCTFLGTPPESEDDMIGSDRRRSSASSTDMADGLESGEVVDTDQDRGRPSSASYRRSRDDDWRKRFVMYYKRVNNI